MTQFRPTPGLADSSGCLCAPTSPTVFAPGSSASFDSKKAERQRIVKQSGAPAIVRMGRMHKFLRGMGQEFSDFDFSGEISPVLPTATFEPTIPPPDFGSYVPGAPSYDLSAIGSPSLPGDFFSSLSLHPTVPTATASLPSAPSLPSAQPSGNISAITSLINAGTSAAKTLTTPTSTMTPAQIAALSAASKTPSGTSWLAQSSVIPGVSNQNVVLFGALGALLLAMGAKK